MQEKEAENLMQEGADFEPRIYEVGFHILPNVSPDDLAKEFASIKAILDKNGATYISEDFPKLRPLAYRMEKVIGTKHEKFKEAYFGWIKFEVGSEAIELIQKELEAHKSVLRFLIIKTVKENTIFAQKISPMRRSSVEKGDSIVSESDENTDDSAVEASQEEIDKSIDELVIE